MKFFKKDSILIKLKTIHKIKAWRVSKKVEFFNKHKDSIYTENFNTIEEVDNFIGNFNKYVIKL